MADAVHLTPLDHHFADFIVRLDSSPCHDLWLAAALTSAATARGHVCLDLATAAEGEVQPLRPVSGPLRPPPVGQWRAGLASCTTVGRPGEYTPLVLDGADRLYLHRSWDHERRAADGLLARCEPVPVDEDFLRAGLDRYFPPGGEAPDWQRVAAMASLTRRLTVISGGPGTGKTATVARILALALELAGAREPAIALAAPTGKAALRLRHSIARATEQLGLAAPLRARMPDRVQTIHRLLGAMSGPALFRHNRDNPLPCDLLVVDEVSMVDLPLMARLLEALRPDCRLILLGDRDQLASVEAGAVLADICNRGDLPPFSVRFRSQVERLCGPLGAEADVPSTHNQREPSPLSDSVIQLRTSYRFGADSGIGALSRLINAGEAAAALDLLQSGHREDLAWRPLPDANGFAAAFGAAVRRGYDGYCRAATPRAALEALEEFRVLSPHRAGSWGVDSLNRLAGAALGLHRVEGAPWCRLLPLMVTANNYELGLFNGDTAVVLEEPGSGRLAAFFPDPEADGGLRRLSPLRLPPWEPALALTVHKSQGSEFDHVLLVLPDRMSEALSRELLYTAVTRARRRVEIWG
ncbi:MAG TPA: exodeoxyribonuclease V subunit alpha, partial [Desulfuromonadaceae bacterium]